MFIDEDDRYGCDGKVVARVLGAGLLSWASR